MTTVRNKFDTVQKTSEKLTPNDEYENFESYRGVHTNQTKSQM